MTSTPRYQHHTSHCSIVQRYGISNTIYFNPRQMGCSNEIREICFENSMNYDYLWHAYVHYSVLFKPHHTPCLHEMHSWKWFLEREILHSQIKLHVFFICRELVKYLIMYVTSKRCIKFNFCTTQKSNCMKEYDSYLIGHIALWSLMWWGLVRWSLWLRRLQVKRPCMREKTPSLNTDLS